MGIFTKIYSFKLNVVRYTNVVRDNLSSSFCWEQIEFITKICLYDWVCRLLRKCKLPFSFKAATPCSINKCLSKCCMGQSKNTIFPYRVGNLIMIEWRLKYVASKSVLCFISVNTKNTSFLCKKSKSKF